ADSGTLKGHDAAKQIEADLTGKKSLKLVVTDGGDGIDYDHADWGEATISYTGDKKPASAGAIKAEPTMKIYHGFPSKPEINGARVVGGTPGHDFLFKIPVTGNGPF